MSACSVLRLIIATLLLQTLGVAGEFGEATCEGTYPRHLQGICTDEKESIYWSWTDALVRTDSSGRLLKRVPAANHHGDLCHHDGRIHVAVNLGKFNQPAGKADSWVYVYDKDSLEELARHPLPEVVHGAGGIAYHGGRFIVVGGLPPGTDENYLYEYDEQFRFRQRHVLASGYTLMGIQTVTYADKSWWFGCYGKPAVLLRADEQFRFNGKWEVDASLGIVPVANGRFLIGKNQKNAEAGYQGRVALASTDTAKGLVFDSAAKP